MCVTLIVLADIMKLLCRSVLLHFVFFIVIFPIIVFVVLGGHKKRRILVRLGIACVSEIQ